MVRKKSDSQKDENDDFFEDPFVAERESFRPAKVANRIKEELLLMVPDSIKDPKLKKCGSVTITEVKCAPDLRNATVRFTLYTSETEETKRLRSAKDAETLLNKAAGFLRRELSERLGIKYTPILHFSFDRGMDHAVKINNLLKSATATNDDSEES